MENKDRYVAGVATGFGAGVAVGFLLGSLFHVAHAQGYVGPPPVQWCYQDGWFPARENGTCYAEDRGKRIVIVGDAPAPVTSSGTVASVSTAAAKCPEGYQLVYIGRVMCARDLREPEY